MRLQGTANPTEPLERFGRRVVVPVSAIVLGAIIIVLAFVLITSVRQNTLALDASTRLAKTALAVKEREIGRNLKDYAVWEDAYKNLHVQLNREWAATDGNVGANILNSLGYEMAFVVDSQERTVYSVVDGEPGLVDAATHFPTGFYPMIKQAATSANPVVGLLRGKTGVALVAATAILPPPGLGDPPAPEDRSILIFAKILNSAFLERMSEEYLLTDLALVGPVEKTGGAALNLISPYGEKLGQIRWTAEEPGTKLIRFVLPPILIALFGLSAFAWLVLRNARRSALSMEVSARTIQAYAQTLENSEARFRDVAEASSDWIWETDPDLRLTYLSDRFSEVTGVAPASILGRSLEQFFSSDSESDGWTHLRGDTRLQNTFRDLRCCYRDAMGSRRICRLAGRPIVTPDGQFVGYRGTATDITPEVEAHARANHLALHDPLTELPNRVLLKDRLDYALNAALRDRTMVAVFCLDLDYFKEVNDTLGHGAGDTLLQQVGERLRQCVRASDTVARLGGDEFAILQVGIESPDEAHPVCRHVLNALQAPFRIGDHEIFIGTSIGVSIAPQDGIDHERLLRNADIALYRAKQAGRGFYQFFETQMDAELQERKALEQDLRQAIAKGELEVHYQPIVKVLGQRLNGVEALLRWRHPQRGLIPPETFIPIAEATGLVIAIGEWTLRTACEQVKAWPGLHVAVNLSPVQFKHRDLVNTVTQVLQETGLEPRLLELEITESVLLYDTKAALEILNTLKNIGVRIAMDDFGTGYSSLAYLNSFPFDKIKIDKSFIADLNRTSKSNAIVKSVISLGRSLDIVITAEGVESGEQLKFLTDEGCKQIQGFYFGKAMSADELTRVRQSWQPVIAPASAA
jgi:diguanylate cyclase (GGDEF)-like protein/PAS domain S-box-containing protein